MNLVERLRDPNLMLDDVGLALVTEAAYTIERLQKEVETAREALEPFASDTARNDPNVMLHFGTMRMDRAREVYRALKDKEVAV